MLAWSLEVQAPHCRLVAVNAPKGSAAAFLALERDLPVVGDAPRHPAGPLAGLHAGLDWARARGGSWLATAPCDTPNLPDDLVVRLRDAANAAGAYAVSPDGRQPLCALWSVSLLEPLGEALAEGVHPAVREFQDFRGMKAARFADADAFANLNRRPDGR